MLRKILTALIIMMGSMAYAADPIITDSTTTSTIDSTTTVNSPPPSAITPSINASNSDLCVIDVAGAVQTQILGISGGSFTIDPNCERLKLSKTLYDMGMKVAAVSVLCQDPRVFEAMKNAGTPCPVDGQIGPEALAIWDSKPEMKPSTIEGDIKRDEGSKNILMGVLALAVIGAIATAH